MYSEAMNTTREVDNVTQHTRALTESAHQLAVAEGRKSDALDDLRREVVKSRTAGILTVPQIASAIGRDRSAVDGIWAAYGPVRVIVDGKRTQTRIKTLEPGTDDTLFASAVVTLNRVRDLYEDARKDVNRSREARDKVIADVYKSELLGPSLIATLVGIDRNHVLRICRKAGVGPAHRTNPKNQYTVQKSEA